MPISPTANSAPSHVFSPAVSRFARNTGDDFFPPAVCIVSRPTGFAAPRKSASAATGVRSETGSPRKQSKLPLSYSASQCIVRTPSISQATDARATALLRKKTFRNAVVPAAKQPASVSTNTTGERVTQNPRPSTNSAPKKEETAASSPPRAKVRKKNTAHIPA